MNEKFKFVFGRVENIVGKRRKCWLPAFSPFPTMFSKGVVYRVIKFLKFVGLVKVQYSTSIVPLGHTPAQNWPISM